MKNRITYLLIFFHTEKGYVIADQLVFSATSFFTTILLARQLGIHSFGIYSGIMLFLYLLLSLISSMVILPFQVLLARDENKTGYMVAVIRMQLLLTFILLLLAGVLLYSPIGIVQPLKSYTPELLLLTGGFLLQDFFRRMFIACQRASLALYMDIVSGGLQLLLLLVAAYRHSLDLSYGLLIIGITYLPSLLIAVKWAAGLKANSISFRKTVAGHWQQGRWLLLTSVLQWWSGNFLIAVAGVFLGVAALGALRLAQTLMGVLNAMFQVIENYAMPRASVLLQQSVQSMKHFLQQLSLKGLCLLVPVLLLLFLFPVTVFRICGGEAYTGYAYALQGMAVLYIIVFAGYPFRIALRAMLMNRVFFTGYLLTFLFTVLAARFIVLQWQLAGVITSLIVNQLLMLGYWQYMLARKKFKLWK
ncbi:MAG: hypothetical protein NTW29_10840 [Bacteroidetes bacterium]|nr:hypothetical protein [Bacteroidota bacterium]